MIKNISSDTRPYAANTSFERITLASLPADARSAWRSIRTRYVTKDNIKLFVAASLIALSSLVFGAEYSKPIHSPEQIVNVVLKSAKLNRKDVKVILLRYDYLKKEWHLELTPNNQACIDCYPSYYIEDTKPPKVKTIPHG